MQGTRGGSPSWIVVGVLAALGGVPARAAPSPEPPKGPEGPAESPSDDLLRIFTELASPSPTIRAVAADAAGRRGHPAFLDPLRALLSDESSAVRVAAAGALGNLGVPRTSADLSALISGLEAAASHPDESTGAAALDALGRFPFPEVRQRLLALASAQGLAPDRQAALARALGRIADPEAPARLAAYLEVSRLEAQRAAAHPSGRLTALPAAERWGLAPDSPLLAVRELLAPDPGGHLGAVRRIAAWPALEARRPFLALALRGRGAAVRRAAAEALANEGSLAGARVLIAALDDDDPTLRALAVSAAGAHADAEITAALALRLPVEPKPELRVAVTRALRTQPEAPLIAALGRWPRQVEEAALSHGVALASTRTSTPAAELLVRFVVDARSESVAGAALAALAMRPDRQAVPALLAAFAAHPHGAEARGRLARGLSGRADPRIVPALLAQVEAGKGDRAVLERLAEANEDEVRAPLLHLTRASNPAARRAALSAVAEYRGQDAALGLTAALLAHPQEERAFELLAAQPPELLTGPLLRLLDRPEHAARHGRILGLLHGHTAPGLSAGVARAASAQPHLAPASIALLAAQPAAAASPALLGLAGDEGLDPEDRARAIWALAAFGEEASEQALYPLAADPELPVRMAARNALHSLDPVTYPAWDPYGRLPLIAASAAFGTTFLLLTSEIAGAELSPAFTGGVGLVLGAATPFLLTLNEDVSLGDAGYFSTLGLWGTLGGWGFGRALGFGRSDVLWATTAGEVLGLAAGALTMKTVQWGVEEVALSNFTAMQAAAVSGAMRALFTRAGEPVTGLGEAAMVGGAAATIPMALLARRLRVDRDLVLIATAMSHGAALGALAPGVARGALSERDALAGVVAGQGLGFLAGLVWAQLDDLDDRAAVYSGAGAMLGAATFGGLGLLLDGAPGQARFGLAQGGMLAGALTLGILGPNLEIAGTDPLIIALAAAAGAAAGARTPEELLGEGGSTAVAGGVLLGAGLGTVAGLVLSQYVDASGVAVAHTVAGGALFGLGGGGLAYLLGSDFRTTRRFASAAGLLGAALTAPFSETLELDEQRVRFALVGAAAGGLWGGSLAAHRVAEGAPLEAEAVGGGLVFGASLGAATTLALAQVLEFGDREIAIATAGALGGTALGAGLGLLVPSFDRSTTAALMQGAGLAGFAGVTTLLATGVIPPRPLIPPPGAGIPTHSAVLGLLGAWHGSLLPSMWRDGEIPAEERAGGALLGASVGGLMGAVVPKLLGGRLAPGDLVEASLIAAAANGVGLGAGLAVGDRRTGAWLTQGLGIAGLGAGLLLAPHTEYDAGLAGSLVAGSLALGFIGGALPAMLGGEPSGGQVAGGVIAGTSAGLLGAALYHQLQPDSSELDILGTELGGAFLGGGLALMLGEGHGQRSALLTGGGALLGLTAGLLHAPHTEYEGGDGGLVTVATLVSAGLGGLAGPLLFGEDATGRHTSGGLLLGAGAGLLGGKLVSQFSELDGLDAAELAVFSSAGALLGGGVALGAGPKSARGRAATVQVATLLGLGAGIFAAPRTEYRLDDVSLVGLTTLAGSVGGAMLGGLWGEDTGTGRGAGFLAGSGAGLVGGMLAAQLWPLDGSDQLETLLLSSAGFALGVGLDGLFHAEDRRRSSLLGGGLGLLGLGAGLALSPHTRYDGTDPGLVTLMAVAGAAHGALLPQLFAPGAVPDGAGRRGALAGLAAGVLAGAALAQAVDLDPSDLMSSMVGWLAFGSIGGGAGLLAPGTSSQVTAGLAHGLGVAGLAAGLALSDVLRYERGDLVLVGLGGGLGAALGLTFPYYLHDPETISASARGGGVLLGAGAGLVGAAVLAQLTDLEVEQVGEAALFTLAGHAAGAGLGLLIPRSDTRLRLGLMTGVGLASLAGGLALAPHTELGEESAGTLGLGAAIGAGLGAATPLYWSGPRLTEVPGEAVGGGLLLGSGLGLAAGLAFDQLLGFDAERRKELALGAASGALAGAGLGLTFSTDDRVGAGLFQGLTLAGAVGVSLLGIPERRGGEDLALGAAYVGYLAWHGLGLTMLLDGTDRQAAGVAMATVGLGSLTGLYITPRLDLRLEDTLMLLAGNVWGTWIGGWGGAILQDHLATDLSGKRSAGLTLISAVLGSDLGLALTGLVVGGLLEVEPTRFAVINLAGLGGMMAGMLVAGAAKDEPLKAGNVIGSLSGLVLGAVVTSFVDFRKTPSWDELLDRTPERPRAERAEDQGRAPSLLSVETWTPSAQIQPNDRGEAQYLLTVMGTWH